MWQTQSHWNAFAAVSQLRLPEKFLDSFFCLPFEEFLLRLSGQLVAVIIE